MGQNLKWIKIMFLSYEFKKWKKFTHVSFVLIFHLNQFVLDSFKISLPKCTALNLIFGQNFFSHIPMQNSKAHTMENIS